jgi:hypothetical protein
MPAPLLPTAQANWFWFCVLHGLLVYCGGLHGAGHGGTSTHPPFAGSSLANDCRNGATTCSFVMGAIPLVALPARVSNRHWIQQVEVMLFGCGHALQHSGRSFLTPSMTWLFTQVEFTFRET